MDVLLDYEQRHYMKGNASFFCRIFSYYLWYNEQGLWQKAADRILHRAAL